MNTAPEGDALRAAALDLQSRFPALPNAVIGRLNQLANRHDVDLFLREQRRRVANQERLERMDTRGRWVRRVQGNGGPGVPGIGHIATTRRKSALNVGEAMCGAQLRGSLEWGHQAVNTAGPEPSWQPCRKCLRVLDMPNLRSVA